MTRFLLEEVSLRLRLKLLKELKPGTRIVSNPFDMGDWKPDKELTVGDPSEETFSHKLYLWIVPQRDEK